MNIFDASTIAQWSQSPYALVILFILSFSESAFFIIPPEVLLIPMGLAVQSMSLGLGALSTIASALGALFGYWIGQKGGKPLLRKLFKKEKVETVRKLFQKYDTKAIFISAFTPIPFKIFTISAGVFDLNKKRFAITSLVGRGTRYMLLSGLILVFGDSIRYFLEHQLDKFILISTIVVIGLYAFYKLILPALEKHFTKRTLMQKLLGIFRKKSKFF